MGSKGHTEGLGKGERRNCRDQIYKPGYQLVVSSEEEEKAAVSRLNYWLLPVADLVFSPHSPSPLLPPILFNICPLPASKKMDAVTLGLGGELGDY